MTLSCILSSVLLSGVLVSPLNRCITNCAHKLTTSKSLILTIAGCQEEADARCDWKLVGPQNHRISRRSVDSDKVGAQFELNPSGLIANKSYRVLFDIGRISAEYSFVIDMIPSGGRCEVTPPEGQVIETPFKITCSGWKDDDSPLWYDFSFVDLEGDAKLLCYGWEPHCDGLALPSGPPERNHKVELLVNITDRLGSFTTVKLSVKVSHVTV